MSRLCATDCPRSGRSSRKFSASGRAGAGSAAEPVPEWKDFRSNSAQNLCSLGARISINFETADSRCLEHFGYKLLHHRPGAVGQCRLRIGIGFEQPAPLMIGTQVPFVAERARFFEGTFNHRLHDALKLAELSLVDREIDDEVHHSLAHCLSSCMS